MRSFHRRRVGILACASSALCALLINSALGAEPAAPPVAFAEGNGRVAVVIDGLPMAVYHYRDDKISRPYFADVRAASGLQVTRHQPPIEGQDSLDHDTFHPGIWMSFGDINGSDSWRMKARVRHAGFAERPKGGPGKGTFAVRNEYLDQQDPSNTICTEIVQYTFLSRPAGSLLLWDSTFSSDSSFSFGDQEEMGLGFRMATPLRADKKSAGNLPPGNGTILDSTGRSGAESVWGNSADWCDYSGTMAGQHVGMTLLCHPKNFRPSWFHVRDNGLLVANPFGRHAFDKGETSAVVVQPGETLRLRYGVLIHSGPPESNVDLAAAYEDYLQVAGN